MLLQTRISGQQTFDVLHLRRLIRKVDEYQYQGCLGFSETFRCWDIQTTRTNSLCCLIVFLSKCPCFPNAIAFQRSLLYVPKIYQLQFYKYLLSEVVCKNSPVLETSLWTIPALTKGLRREGKGRGLKNLLILTMEFSKFPRKQGVSIKQFTSPTSVEECISSRRQSTRRPTKE